jgi:sulfonate transport system permease protein
MSGPLSKRLLTSFAAPLTLLGLWQALTLLAMAQSGELQHHVGDSLSRLLIGFALGALAGLVFGTLAALSKWARAALWPLFLTAWQVPVIAFVPVLVVFLGIDETFKIAIVAIASFFPVALATCDGIRGLPRAWFDVTNVYRTPLPQMLWYVLIPATVPAVLTGLRIAITRAWVVLVAAELLAADSGIGQMMEMGRQLFQIDVVLAGVVTSGLIGFLLDRGARAVEARATRWRMA